MKKTMKTDVLIIGTGASGLFAALHIPEKYSVLMLTKSDMKSSDSYLAQGGICMLKSEEDYNSYFEDTLNAGHYENNRQSVDIMIRSSRQIIRELIGYGVEFAKDENGELLFTREGAHSTPRILFHEDITGQEITSKLLSAVQKRKNVKISEHTTMIDILEKDNECAGVIAIAEDGSSFQIEAPYTIFACGGIGGLYEHSTNFSHITGDALAICIRHDIKLKDIDYVQIHPTTLYSEKPGRRFLISESVRGEGAVLYDKNHRRFVDELLPRDKLSRAIKNQMKKDGTPYVWLSMEQLPKETIMQHFPNIYQHCLEEGFDVTHECIPVVPAQHYFMGGIKVDENSKTSMNRLYAVGEISCNGVHGANRLASNSLLESLVFSERAVCDIIKNSKNPLPTEKDIEYKNILQDLSPDIIFKQYRIQVLQEIERMKQSREKRSNNEAEHGPADNDGSSGGYFRRGRQYQCGSQRKHTR